MARRYPPVPGRQAVRPCPPSSAIRSASRSATRAASSTTAARRASPRSSTAGSTACAGSRSAPPPTTTSASTRSTSTASPRWTPSTSAHERHECGRAAEVDVVAPGDRLPFADDSVDFVLASHVIEHFPDPIAALEEWRRVARRVIVLVVPHRDRTFDRDRPLTPLAELASGTRTGFQADEDRHWRSGPRRVHRLCEHLSCPCSTRSTPTTRPASASWSRWTHAEGAVRLPGPRAPGVRPCPPWPIRSWTSPKGRWTRHGSTSRSSPSP